MSHNRVLIVHPDPKVRSLLSSMLQSIGGEILEAASDRAAVRMMDQQPAQLVLAGVEPSDPDALQLLAYVRRKHEHVPIILLFSELRADLVREAFQWGVASVLRFPAAASQLRAAAAQALGITDDISGSSRSGSHVALRNGGNGSHDTRTISGNGSPQAPGSVGEAGDPRTLPERCSLGSCRHDIIGDDTSLREAIDLAGSIAPTLAPVLILGEPGSGKSLLANLLHRRSPRQSQDFQVLDCNALKDQALELELFGRTGSGGDERPGKLAMANGGTLLLEEISALAPETQFKLLRLLHSGEYEPVGSTFTHRVDIRFVFSSRVDLIPLVDTQAFRRDLFYRISVVTLNLPPLRHRGEDIVRLAEHFRELHAKQAGRPAAGFTPEALELLRHHPWPDNVRELESVIQRAVLLCRDRWIEPGHLEFTRREAKDASPNGSLRRKRPASGILPLKEALEGPERQLILQALEALNWNRQETARVLDINRTTLYKKMKKYGLLFDEPVWAN